MLFNVNGRGIHLFSPPELLPSWLSKRRERIGRLDSGVKKHGRWSVVSGSRGDRGEIGRNALKHRL